MIRLCSSISLQVTRKGVSISWAYDRCFFSAFFLSYLKSKFSE